MADELEKLWSKLKFTEEEDEGHRTRKQLYKGCKSGGQKLYSYEDSDHEKLKSRHTEEELENALEAESRAVNLENR